jgi:hypothetical protein
MAVARLERFRHPDPAFEIDLPSGMEVGVMPGVLVVARAPEGATTSPFRTNLTVVAQELPAGVDASSYAEFALAEEARSFPDFRLIDRAPARLTCLDAERTLATYRLARDSGVDFGRPLSITVEQWRAVHEDLAWIVSASCETPDYALVADLWTACAESLRPGAPTE